jgi:hypothetical protein
MMAYRIGRRGEFQFWGLGAATMLSTAWLFGTAFAKPSRTVIGAETGPPGDAKTDALIQLAGPMVNLIAAGISLVLIPLGGFFALAGSAGFSLNLLSYVYGMLPIMPMEGKTVYDWNRGIWAGIFFPLLLVYLWLFMV